MSERPPPSAPTASPGRVQLWPTSEFWRYLWFPAVFSVGSLLLRQELVFLLGALVVGCGAAAFPLCRRNLAGVRVSRLLPARAQVGTPVGVSLLVRNTARHAALGVEVEDRPGKGVRCSVQRLDVPHLAPGRELRAHVRLRFQRRGWQRLRAPQVSSRFPLGVFRSASRPGEPDDVLVWPREGRALPALLTRLRGGADAVRRRRRQTRGSDELVEAREWRAGDDPRRLHARASARRGQPVVTEWGAEASRDVLVVFAGGVRASPEQLERAVSASATVWRACQRLGPCARLVVGARVLRGGGHGAFAAGMDLLAEVAVARAAEVHGALERLSLPSNDRRGSRTVVLVSAGPVPDLVELARRAAGPRGEVETLDVSAPDGAQLIAGLP